MLNLTKTIQEKCVDLFLDVIIININNKIKTLN